MMSPIRFGGVFNALRSQEAAQAVADQYRSNNPREAVAVFHSGIDYAVFTGEDAKMAKAAYDAAQSMREAAQSGTAGDINRRLDNWLGGMAASNKGNNTRVTLIDYLESRNML